MLHLLNGQASLYPLDVVVPDQKGLLPVEVIDVTFFCKKCDGMATKKTCPHGPKDRISISGTRQREMLTKGEEIPKEFSRPEVVAVLRDYYAGL